MKKTMLWNLLMGTVMLLTAYAPMVGETAQAWFGVIAAAITLFLNLSFTTSGKWIAEGWSWTQWAISIAQIVLQIGYLVTSEGLIPPHIVNMVMVAATFAVQYFGKVYKTEERYGGK